MILRLGKISSLFALSLCYLGQASFLKAQQDLPPEVLAYADKILYNGKVLTADDQFTIGEAVAIRGGEGHGGGTERSDPQDGRAQHRASRPAG